MLQPRLRFGEFGEEWASKKLTNLTKILNGLTYKPINVRSNGTFVIRSSNIQKNQIINNNNVYVEKSIVNVENVKKNDIIVVVRNGSKKLIGKHAMVTHEMEDTVIGAFMSILRSKNGKFVNSILDSNNFTKNVYISLGATINQITKKDFSMMKFTIPKSIKEQEKIGTFFSHLDHLIQLQQAKLDHLKRLKTGYLQRLFPNGDSKMPAMRFKGFEDEWKNEKLNKLITERNDKIPESDKTPLMAFIANVGIADKGIRYDRSALIKDKNKKYKLTKKNDFIYSSNNFNVGSIGLNNYGNAVISPVYNVFYSKNNIDIFFFNIYSKSKSFKYKMNKYKQGVTYGQYSVSSKDFLSIIVKVPSLQEQKRIGAFFTQIDTLIQSANDKLTHLTQIKTAYLQKMFI